MVDYNGIELPTKAKASDVKILVIQKYEGKFGEEEHVLENCTLEEWCGIDDVVGNLEIEESI